LSTRGEGEPATLHWLSLCCFNTVFPWHSAETSVNLYLDRLMPWQSHCFFVNEWPIPTGTALEAAKQFCVRI